MLYKYNYILERDKYVNYYWEISFSFDTFNFRDNDRIIVLRTNHVGRHMEINIMKNLTLYSYNDGRQIFNNNIRNSGIVNVMISSKPNNSFLYINRNKFELPNLYCQGVLTEINSTLPIIQPNITYLNFNSTIPRVYGDCFTNQHTHKMFGKYLLEEGSNYYCVNFPSVCDVKIIFDIIAEDIKACPPSKVYIFMKSHLKYIGKWYKKLKKEYPNVNFVICTMPHKLGINKNYNEDIRKKLYFDYIDFDKCFEDIENLDDYFIDNSHTNGNGAQIIVEKIKQDAPDLLRNYEI